MKDKVIRVGLFFAILVSLINCAKRGTPGGGPRDITSPEITKASPKLNTTNFKGKRIRISFNEYIKLNELQKQLIISPPLKQFPQIRPQGSANTFIDIIIKDTLRENTTYVLNFGQSIVDNNEGNPYSFFKYVFSTGDYIDSLTVSGFIKDAKKKEADEFVSVMLYEIDSTYTDSIIYKKPPTYITNTLDSVVSFELTNLKAGKYMLIAMKDISSNNLFNQKTDKIAFIENFIEIPTDSIYTLNLFKEINDYRASKPSLVSKNRIIFGYEGDPENKMNIELLSDVPDDFHYKIVKEHEKDTLNYWFTPIDVDSLIFKVSHPTKIDTFNIKFKDLYNDSLILTPKERRNIKFGNPYIIHANIPLVKNDTNKITLIDKDSISIPFNAEIDSLKNEFKILWEIAPSERYQLKMLPGALEDFYGNSNDTINYFINSKGYADLGSINVTLQNVTSFPLIIQLIDDNGDVAVEQFADSSQFNYDFRYLNPGNYFLRVIFDSNGNKKWDTGNYLQKLQPERIAYYPEAIELRANWEPQIRFILD